MIPRERDRCPRERPEGTGACPQVRDLGTQRPCRRVAGKLPTPLLPQPFGNLPPLFRQDGEDSGCPASKGQTLTGSHLSGCKAGLLGTMLCLPAGGSGVSGQCTGAGDPRGHWEGAPQRHRAPAATPGPPAPSLRDLCPSTALAPPGPTYISRPCPTSCLAKTACSKSCSLSFFFSKMCF